MLAAFLDRAQPDAICIERSPEAFARNDYYEFTYEVQDVIVPFARARGVDLCPIDWAPPSEDAKLGFGTDLEAIPQVRPDQGFQGFLSFPRPAQLNRDIFHADTEVNLAKVAQWAVTPQSVQKMTCHVAYTSIEPTCRRREWPQLRRPGLVAPSL